MIPARAQVLAVAMVLLTPFSAFGHAVVSPATSRPGAYERYVLRVPNEADVATVKVEMRFPDAVRVISFVDVPGWTLHATMDSTGRAVSAEWTGTLPPERFVELPFIAVNPGGRSEIAWPVVQTYADGQRIEWSGPRESDEPASVTRIGGGAGWTTWLPLVLAAFAFATAFLALALAMRSRAPMER